MINGRLVVYSGTIIIIIIIAGTCSTFRSRAVELANTYFDGDLDITHFIFEVEFVMSQVDTRLSFVRLWLRSKQDYTCTFGKCNIFSI